MNRTTKRILQGIAIVFVILFVIAVAIPNFIPKRACACASKADNIVNALAELDAAKQQWIVEHRFEMVTNLTWQDLSPYDPDERWNNPIVGETYQINKIDEPVSVIVRVKTDWIPAYTEMRFSSGHQIQIRSTAAGSPWKSP